MRLYHYPRSSSSWRVRIALHHKDIAVESVLVDLHADANHTAQHRQRNPIAQVPVLEWEEEGELRQLAQSLAIVLYLEQRWPARPLLPADPYARARAWQLAELVNAGIQPHQNLYAIRHLDRQGGDGRAWARHHIQRGLDALELEAQKGGTFLIGDRPTVADICLIPQLYSARGVGLDDTAWPTLVRIDAACAALPAFQAAHPDRSGG